MPADRWQDADGVRAVHRALEPARRGPVPRLAERARRARPGSTSAAAPARSSGQIVARADPARGHGRRPVGRRSCEAARDRVAGPVAAFEVGQADRPAARHRVGGRRRLGAGAQLRARRARRARGGRARRATGRDGRRLRLGLRGADGAAAPVLGRGGRARPGRPPSSTRGGASRSPRPRRSRRRGSTPGSPEVLIAPLDVPTRFAGLRRPVAAVHGAHRAGSRLRRHAAARSPRGAQRALAFHAPDRSRGHDRPHRARLGDPRPDAAT